MKYNIIICCFYFFPFFFKVKDSWDVDSDAESEDSSNDKGVYVKKKTLILFVCCKGLYSVDCMDIVQSYSCCILFCF